jgi:hypothetical protein
MVVRCRECGTAAMLVVMAPEPQPLSDEEPRLAAG